MDAVLVCFCDVCGASVAPQASLCTVCGKSPHQPLPLAPSVSAYTALPAFPSQSAVTGSLPPGSLLAQRYRILGKAGEGGFGVIYKAEDIDRYRAKVAIKQINLDTLRPREMIEATDAYNREVRYLSRLRHISLPRMYDAFTDKDHWYIVMDYIDGITLEETLKKTRGKRLPLRKVLQVGLLLCDVLGYLHAQQPSVIFRDVKPANIMQTRAGHLYLIDFGIARHYTPGRNRDTGPLGTPGYAAPEQYGRAQTTTQTDIYGLGATLQTLLTGQEPTLTPKNRRKKFFQGKIRWQLQQLLQQMLELDASLRPQTIEEVRQRLQQLFARVSARRRFFRCLFIALRESIADALLFTLMLAMFFAILLIQTPWLFVPIYGSFYLFLLLLKLFIQLRIEKNEMDQIL
jgi:serine/threonine protein kinase